MLPMASRTIQLFIVLLLLSVSYAQVSLPPWSWDSYTGSTQWRVTVTEDDSGCQGQGWSNQYTTTIDFTPGHGLMGDIGHGPASGRVQNNVLTIPGRTVSDPPGSSVLSPYDITFTSDCLTFTGEYTWDYSGPDGGCSGSTTLSGTIVNGCPAPTTPVGTPSTQPTTIEEDIANARTELNQDLALRSQVPYPKAQIDALEPRIEAEYNQIFNKDPNNFQANVDMAELKKTQGLPHEYYQYMDRALSGGAVTESVKEAVEANIAKELGFSKFPKPANSLLMRRVGFEDSNYQGTIYGEDVKKDADDATWKVRLLTIFAPPETVVSAIVFNK
jgi:hypothetical protein